MAKHLIALLVLLVAALASVAASARQACQAEHVMLAFLSERYSEFPVFRGTIDAGTSLVLTRSDDGSGWTALIVQNGVACITAAGSRSRFDKGV